MKGTGRGIQRLQHNIVDLFPGIPAIQSDEAFTMDGRKHTHTTHIHVRTKLVAPNKCCGTFFVHWFGQVNQSITASKVLQLFSSNLNMQNSVVMFTFFDFDRKYHFWVNLVQKVKVASLF